MTKRVGVAVLVSLCPVVAATSCVDDSPSAVPTDVGTLRSALLAPIQNDFEDGTLQGWIPRGPVTLTNTTEAAFNGTRSLKTTGRVAAFNGPSLSLTNQLAKGAMYQVGVSVRLVPGAAPTTIRVTMQRTLPGGTNQFDTIAQNTNVTDAAWTTFNAPYSFSTDVTGLLLYVEATDPTVSYYIDAFSLVETAPPPLSSDFEDGTLQGWIPRGGGVVLTNTTEQAFAGTRSLKTTGRTAGFMGPSLPLTAQLTRGATYGVTVSGRLVAGTPATTLRVTVQRTLPGGANQFDFVAQNTNVTDAAWVTMTGLYSFNTDVTGLLLYVESTSATASYYIDSFSIVQLAPAPGPPGNTAGAAATFESGGLEGWFSRTGVEIVTNTTADANTGTRSLLTTNRTATFRGPAFNVTNVMFNGSRYRVEVWAKLAPGEPTTQLRVSLERRLGTFATTFHTLVGNTTVTNGAWVLLATTVDLALANTSLTLYVETASGNQSFFIDDFKVQFIPPAVAELDIPSVYQTVAPYFPFGAAVRTADLTGQSAVLLTKHFNSMTSENDMKWDATEPTEGTFTFTNADAEVNFAKANNMRVWGHTLVWHNQVPAWVFLDASGNPMTPTPANRELLIQRMRNHIQGVVTHFGTDVYSWDVVNEAIDQSQADGFRRTQFFNIIGPEYIDIAFQAAREFAPTAKLYYNDFSTTDTTKLGFIAALVSGMKNRGVPIDGVGHQMHNNVDFPSGAAVTNAINTIHALGVENAVTELDVSVYSGSFPGPVNDYTLIPPERFVRQGYRYLTFQEAFKQLALEGKLKSVTTWGKSDAQTWLTSATRVDGPLLFDVSFKKKHAYWAFVDPLQLPGADLATTMTAAPMTVPAGQAVAYTITVTNRADRRRSAGRQRVAGDRRSRAHGVRVTDRAGRLDVQSARGRRDRAGAVHDRVAARGRHRHVHADGPAVRLLDAERHGDHRVRQRHLHDLRSQPGAEQRRVGRRPGLEPAAGHHGERVAQHDRRVRDVVHRSRRHRRRRLPGAGAGQLVEQRRRRPRRQLHGHLHRRRCGGRSGDAGRAQRARRRHHPPGHQRRRPDRPGPPQPPVRHFHDRGPRHPGERQLQHRPGHRRRGDHEGVERRGRERMW
jgi:endo-1,4-beta-xylanase